MKRIFAFFLAFMMLFSSMPVEALATASSNTENSQTQTNPENSLTFTNTENGLTFSLPKAKAAADDGIQTAAEEMGPPIRFFVTTLEEAQKYNGSYQNYKQDQWGTNGGTSGAYAIPTVFEGETGNQINSLQGIRANMVESEIIKYVGQWPNNDEAAFRQFDSITIGGQTYSGEEYEVQWVTICGRNRSCGCGARYDHVHIDGILRKKTTLESQPLNLSKEISTAQSADQTFRFNLYQLGLDGYYKPTDQIIGSSVADYVATIPAGQTSASITLENANAKILTGYYKLVEADNIGWKQSGVTINTTGKSTTGNALYIQFLDNGTVKYSCSANTGYTAANSATIYNEKLPTRDIRASKVWDDNGNQDGLRPNSVTAHLLINNTHYGTTQTLSAENSWTATWKDVPYSANYSYHVEEVIPEGYTCKVTGNASNGFTLTNTHTPETTTIQARKHWDDDNNRDGKRPSSVSLQLYSNGAAKGNPVTVNAASNWQASWADLPVKANGQNITYTVRETSVPADYVNGPIQVNGQSVTYPSYSIDNRVLVVTNKKVLETTSLSITKIWDDNNDQDDLRPDSITLNLFVDGVALSGVNGKAVSLTVTPNAESEEDQLVFSDMPKTSSGTEVPLSAEFEKDSDNQWNIKIHGLLKYVSGSSRNEIPYVVRESEVAGYTTTYTDPTNNSKQWTITNKHTPETVEIPVSKVWVDDNNRDGIRPASITVSVKNGDTVVDTIELNTANNWTSKSDPLPKYDNRNVIEYTVEETGYKMASWSQSKELETPNVIPAPANHKNGYTAVVSGSIANGYTITNTHECAVISVTVTKQWDDLNDNDRSRPYAVEVELRQSGVTIANAKLKGKEATTGIELSHTWTQTSSGDPLYRYNNGIPITYTVEEVGHYTEETLTNKVNHIPDGYSVTHYYSTQNPELFKDVKVDHLQALVVNKYTPAVTSLNIQKVWVDDNNRDGARPDSLEFEVWRTTTRPEANDKGISTVVPSTNNGWEYVTTVTMIPGEEGRWLDITVNNLPKIKQGLPYYYGVKEVVPADYEAAYALNLNRDVVTVTNTKELESTNITVTKEWEDNNNQDGIRPKGVVMTLYSGGTKLKDANGKAVTLTIQKDATTGVLTANISAPVRTPTGVTVPLEVTDVTETGNQWSATINGLLKYAYDKEGVLSVYSVEETGYIKNNGVSQTGTIPGYTVSGIGNTNNAYTITNTHTTETVEIPVSKIWNDNENQDGKRPSSVILSLEKRKDDNESWTPVDNVSLTLTNTGNWTGKFTALPKYEGGKEIKYKVVEAPVAGYTLVTENTVWTGGTVTLTNRHTPETTTVTAKKIWNDTNNIDKMRPTEVKFHLLNDAGHMGTAYKAVLSETATGSSSIGNTGVSLEYTKDANGNWTVKWKNLPKYSGGDEIDYRVEEEEVGNNYSVSYSRDENGTIYVTNTRTQDTTSVTTLKLWDDDYNRDGKRPESIQVTLYGRDKTTALRTTTLDAAGHWKHTWENLPVNDETGKIPYTVKETGYRLKGSDQMETGVPSGYIDGKEEGTDNTYPVYHTDNGVLVITNRHKLETTPLTVHKQWADNNNQDGMRPDGVIMTLYAGGTPMTGTDNQPLTLTIRKNSGAGENAPLFVASASANVKTPTGVEVPLTVGEVTVSTDKNQWSVTLDGLLKYASDAEGIESVYSLVETGYVQNGTTVLGAIPGYTASGSKNTDGSYTITNTHTPETVEIPVVKKWEDEENQDGKRPASVSLSLKQSVNGTDWVDAENSDRTPVTLSLSAAGNWTGKFTALPKYEGGTEIKYKVVEAKVTHYNLDKNGNAQPVEVTWDKTKDNGTVTITNVHIPETINLTAKKVWNDEEDQDKKRPDSIVFHILADGQHLGDANKKTLTAASNWSSVTWENLPKYKAGKEIVYAVREEPIEADGANYVVSYSAIQDGEITVTNSRQTDKTNVIVRKAWDDDNNRDGMRPTEITVNLMWRTGTGSWQPVQKNGEDITVTLAAAGNWTSTVTGLDLNHDGHRIEYSVVESTVPTGYINGTEEGTGNTYPAYHTDNGVLVVTNKHVLEKTSITVTKNWDDGNNQDGMRPDGVVMTLYSGGTVMKDASGNPVTLTITENDATISPSVVTPTGRTVPLTVSRNNSSDDNQWSVTISGLLKNAYNKIGEASVYTIAETGYIKGSKTVSGAIPGYTASGIGNEDNSYTITNTHTPETVDIRIIKEWDDARNQDGKRPNTITVYAYNGDTKVKSITLRASDNWVGTISGLDKYADGSLIPYIIKEDAVKKSDDAEYKMVDKVGEGAKQIDSVTPENGTATIINQYIPETINLTATKVWDDANNADGIRPKSVTFHLLNDMGHMGTAYKAVLSETAGTSTAVSDTDVVVKYGKDTDGNWTVTWENLPKYSGGVVIDYVVQEEAVEEYTTSYARNEYGGIVVTNTRAQDITDITVNKRWDDDGNRDGMRPESITANLMWRTSTNDEWLPVKDQNDANLTATLTADNHWKYTWTRLPRNKSVNGTSTAIQYTVTETALAENLGYNAPTYEEEHTGWFITNSRDLEKKTLTITKVWDDHNNQDGKRPTEGITFHLLYNGVPMPDKDGRPVTLTVAPGTENDVTFSAEAAVTATGVIVPLSATVSVQHSNTENDQWIITIPNLLKHVSGKVRDEIAYSVTEEPVEGYTTTYAPAESTVSGAGISNHWVITNTHEPETITIPVTKTWLDDSNRDGIRPESVTVSLKRNGRILQSVELNVTNNWINEFAPVPRYENREDISTTYTVEETAYRMADWNYTKIMETPNKIPAHNGRFTGYTAAVTGSANTGFVVTNTHEVDKIKVSVTNQWDDYDNNDGKRPHSVEVELRKNGITINCAELAGTAEVSHHPLSHTWDKDAAGTPLYRYEAGVIVTYTVVETGHRDAENETMTNTIPEDYSVDHFYSTQDPDKFTNVSANLIQALIVNQYTPKRTSLNIQKQWVDDYDREGLRPNSLTFQVWETVKASAVNANEQGISTVVPGEGDWNKVTTVIMSRGAGGQWWDITVPDLPMYRNTQRIYYAVTEIGHTDILEDGTTAYTESIPEGYENGVSYSLNTNDDVVTVTNTHEIRKIDVAVSKQWDDENNRDNKRPQSVTVTLYANGIATSETETLSNSNNWSYTWPQLFAYYMGKPITYSVVENAVDGYKATYTPQADGKIIITNSHTPETTTVKVSKVWDDGENRDRIRPDSVTVSVKNGNTIVDTITLNANNYWTAISKALPKYAAGAVGQEISYTVEEADVTGYNSSAAPAKDSKGEDIKNDWIVTNTHTPETVTITADKVWNDGDDRDGKRPAEVTFHLLADNEHLGETYKRVANAANNWSVSWSGADLYKYNSGEPIHYSVLEEITTRNDGTETTSSSENTRAVEDYIPTYEQDAENVYHWTVTNTYIPEETEVRVTKIWDDDNNRDGLRTNIDKVTVRLLADGKPVQKKDASGADVDDTIIIEAANNWVGSWTHLPKNKKIENRSVPIVYTVEEINVPDGYNVDVEDETDHGVANHFVLTNTHAPQTTGVSVRKIWNDEDNNDLKRPDGLIVQLYANGEPVAGTQVLLNDANAWSYTWQSTKGIPLYVNQTVWNEAEQKYVTSAVRYAVLEIGYVKDGQEYTGLPEGYVGSSSKEGNYNITLTNTRASEKITVSVWHIWEDDNNNDGIRPAEISVTLTRGSLESRSIPDTVTMSATSNWEHQWSGLYRYQGGVVIDYTIEELSVAGYTTTYNKQTDPVTGNIKIIVTHTHTNAEHNLTVSKVWKDNNNRERLRSTSVKAQLYKNGVAFGDEIILSAANNWKEPVKLPVYENGVAIAWTVKETSIPRYYTASYDQTTLTITNTIQSKYVPKTGDFNNLGMWILLLGGFSTGAAAILLHDKKRKNK